MLRTLATFNRNYLFSINKVLSKNTLTRKNQIEQILKNNKYVLFMKGTPQIPKCGFSNFVVEVLKFYNVKQYKSVDVLIDKDLKEQIKIYSQWPTFPQFYVDGKLIGGCDILLELHKQKKLIQLFKNTTKNGNSKNSKNGSNTRN